MSENYEVSLEETKALVRRYFEEVWNNKNIDVVEEYFPTDIVDQQAPGGQGLLSPEAAKEYLAAVHAAFPDIRVTIDDMIAEVDKVAIRTTWYGTHTGESMDVPPTGRSITVSGNVIWHIADGKVVEMWGTRGEEELYETGLMPRLEQHGEVFFKWPPWR